MSPLHTTPTQLFPFLSIPNDLGDFTVSQFFTRRQYLYAEHTCLYKEIAHKHQRLHSLDKQITQCKQIKPHGLLEQLIERRKSVQDDLVDLQGQIYTCDKLLRATEQVVDDGIVLYAKSWCRTFTTRMLEIMPREIVDLVYEWMLDTDVVSSIGHQVLQQVENACCIHQTCKTAVPHFLDLDFVPSQMSTELLSLIAKDYATLNPDLHTFRSKETITSLVTTRALHLDVPASSFFCNLHIQLHILSLAEQYRLNAQNCKASTEDPELHQHLSDLLLALTPSKTTRVILDIVYPRKRGYRDPLLPGLEKAVRALEGGEWKALEVNWRNGPSWPIAGWPPVWKSRYCEVHDHLFKMKLHWCDVEDDEVVVKPWR